MQASRSHTLSFLSPLGPGDKSNSKMKFKDSINL
jgi:hypothetical protein